MRDLISQGASGLTSAGADEVNLAHGPIPSVRSALGQRLEGGVLLTRPLTRFIVAFDAEHDYASAESRERQRQIWIDRIMEAMPADTRSARIRQQIDSLVEVDSWSDQVFEFAHFTNREIAVAVNRLLRKKRPGAKPVTAADVQRVRSSPTPNVEHVYRRYRLSKVDLALEMWTFLLRRIQRARTDEELDAIPVVKVVRSPGARQSHGAPGRNRTCARGLGNAVPGVLRSREHLSGTPPVRLRQDLFLQVRGGLPEGDGPGNRRIRRPGCAESEAMRSRAMRL